MHTITVPTALWETVKADLRTLSLKAGGLPMPAYKRHQAEMLNARLREAGPQEVEGVVQGWEAGATPNTIQLRIGQ